MYCTVPSKYKNSDIDFSMPEIYHTKVTGIQYVNNNVDTCQSYDASYTISSSTSSIFSLGRIHSSTFCLSSELSGIVGFMS